MTDPKLSMLIQPYQEYLEALNRRPSGVRRYIDQVRAYVASLDPDAGPDAVTRTTITRYRVDMSKRGCAGGTMGNAMTSIRSFCRWLIDEELLDTDPTERMAWPQRDDPVVRVLSLDELRQLDAVLVHPKPCCALEHFIYGRNQRAILCMLYAGLRISEAAALLWRDIHLNDKVLMVRCGKGGRRRELPIHPALEAVLRAAPSHRPSWPVAGTMTNSPLTPKSMAHIFERWLTERGLFITAHQLRRTFATQLLRRGANLRDIQLLLGHRSLKTTAAYLGADTKDLEQSLSKLPMTW